MSKHTSRASGTATQLTRTGKLNMQNRKPYRTASQRAAARSTARIIDGRFVSNAPTSMHSAKQRRVAA